MKIIRYKICKENQDGDRTLLDVQIECDDSTFTSNMEIATREAVDGAIIVEDVPCTEEVVPTTTERLDALEAAMLEMMGVV